MIHGGLGDRVFSGTDRRDEGGGEREKAELRTDTPARQQRETGMGMGERPPEVPRTIVTEAAVDKSIS